MKAFHWKSRLPGIIAIGLVTLTTSLWTWWSLGEMYYEGWGLSFPRPLSYLVPSAVCLALTLFVLTWPRLGGWLLIGVGGWFTVWWWNMQFRRMGELSLANMLIMFPVSGMLVITGVLFLLQGRFERQRRAAGWTPHPHWWRRNLRYLVGLGAPLLVLVVVSATQLPTVLTRFDNGSREAQWIEGNGVSLLWAPSGPGWNWTQPGRWNPSWNHIALYGALPVGLKDRPGTATAQDMAHTDLCRYLGEDGRTLMPEPQNIWRMPTTDEMVRSLVRDGQNAGCTWNGQDGRAVCRVLPDKEMPLWAPEQSAIYYWTADEFDPDNAWYVSYNGWVHRQPKGWGNSRHGHRCVRRVAGQEYKSQAFRGCRIFLPPRAQRSERTLW